MAYIHSIQTDNNNTYLIEPTLYTAASAENDGIFTAAITNFTPVEGVTIQVSFSSVNSGGDTLSINSGPDVAIYYNDDPIPAGLLKANYIYELVYKKNSNNNYCWHIVGDITPYESKPAVENGTALSLVTTGEKYEWTSKRVKTYGDENIGGKKTFTDTVVINKAADSVPECQVKLGNTGLAVGLQIGSENENHGVYSYGYRDDNSETFTASGKWIIHRDKTGAVKVDGHGITDNDSSTAVTSSDTNLITARTLYYAGYTKNSGTVTSVTITQGAGITVSSSGTAITSTGTRTISITGMNTSSGSTTKCLTQKGTWATFGTSNLEIGTSATTAAAGNHGHNTLTMNRTTTGNWLNLQGDATQVGRLYWATEGVANTEGWSILQLGNATASTAAGNASGQVRLYNKNGGYVRLSGAYGSLGGTNRNYLNIPEYLHATQVWGAVWNDYAEMRKCKAVEAGRCVTETVNGTMELTEGRLQAGCKIISDTYGFCIGETKDAKIPIAVCGRVLAYPFKDPSGYHLGDAVCSAPGGTIDIMTREEIREYPERIIGTISEIPKYDKWIAGTQDEPEEIQVKGRIWIYVK